MRRGARLFRLARDGARVRVAPPSLEVLAQGSELRGSQRRTLVSGHRRSALALPVGNWCHTGEHVIVGERVKCLCTE